MAPAGLEISGVEAFIAIGGPGAVGLLGWWLSGRFRNLERSNAATLSAHELKDQNRHEQNLARFERISIALARLGIKRQHLQIAPEENGEDN